MSQPNAWAWLSGRKHSTIWHRLGLVLLLGSIDTLLEHAGVGSALWQAPPTLIARGARAAAGFDGDGEGAIGDLLPSAAHTRAAYRTALPHRDGFCMTPPREWGPPVRVLPARVDNATLEIATPPMFVFADVLVASDPACARVTTVRGGRAGGGTPGGPLPDPLHPDEALLNATLPRADGDGERVVYATHQSVRGMGGGLEGLARLAAAWGGGCLSVGVFVCDEGDWAAAAALHAAEPALRERATLHVAIGWAPGRAPYPTAMRNVPLLPFAPWAPPPPGGGARPQPWVLVADADALPSVGEGVLRRWVAAAVAGRLGIPPTHDMGLASSPNEASSLASGLPPLDALPKLWFPMTPEAAASDVAGGVAPPAVDCDAWDGAPEPMRCSMQQGTPDGQRWARRAGVAARAIARSRCAHPLVPSRTAFVAPSFDVTDATRVASICEELVRYHPPGAAPSRAHAFLAHLLATGVAKPQAPRFPPAYEAMVPWAAWAAAPPHTPGVLAVHHSHLSEPYVILKAPLPGDRPAAPPPLPWAPAPWDPANTGDPALLDAWQPFDETLQGLFFDKQAMVADLAAAPPHSPAARLALHMLPQFFLLNVHAGESVATARTAEELRLKDAAFQRLADSLEARGLACRDSCPCVDAALG